MIYDNPRPLYEFPNIMIASFNASHARSMAQLMTDAARFAICLRLAVWRSVSALALINEVNLRRARLVLRWATVSGSIPGAEHLFRYLAN